MLRILFFLLLPHLALAGPLSKTECVTVFSARESKRPRATPQEVLNALLKLKTADGSIVFSEISDELRTGVTKYFSAKPENSSRLEHFYALLYLMGHELRNRDDVTELDLTSAKNVMKESKVFPNDLLTNAMASVKVGWRHYNRRAEWEVKLDTPELVIPLNDGKGFHAYNHGYCQEVDNLHIYGGFEVSIGLNKDQNIEVKFRDPVDFSGDFGSRGVADINVKYISLYEIEFQNGSKIGTSKAKVAKREFREVEHSWIFEILSGMVSEKSSQPIDW